MVWAITSSFFLCKIFLVKMIRTWNFLALEQATVQLVVCCTDLSIGFD